MQRWDAAFVFNSVPLETQISLVLCILDAGLTNMEDSNKNMIIEEFNFGTQE